MASTVTKAYGGAEVEVSSEGFLVDPRQWTPGVAEGIAREVGIGELGEDHWRVIAFCRADSARRGYVPSLRRMAVNAEISMPRLFELFPGGPRRVAARVSGLARPRASL